MTRSFSGPDFWFPTTSARAGPGFLTDPAAWLILGEPSQPPCLEGVSIDTDGDSYRLLDRFMSAVSGGIVAGWLSYDLAYEQHAPGELPSAPDALPRMVLAHYPAGGSTALPSAPRPRLGRFCPVPPRERYLGDVRRIRRRIEAGYVYQVNYSQRFRAVCAGSLRGLLPELETPPPHAAGAFLGSREVLSLSPERFLRVEGDRVLTQPIKGTRPRGETPAEDRRLGRELRESPKDRAEHVMIVDLERNDLNRVCRPGTVQTSELCEHRRFAAVHHLVSTVEGRLRPGVTPGTLLRRTFPGGSVTGAPKSTALRVIHELEGRRRGVYTGSLGFRDLERDVADWNLAIRTLVRRESKAHWDAGGGIVHDSDPAAEYEECLDKVRAVRRFESPVPAGRG